MALRKSLRGKREGSPSWLESDLISAAAAVKPRQARAASPSSLKLQIQTAPHGNFPAIQINLLHAYWRKAFVLASHDVPGVWMKEETESINKKKKAILDGNSREIQNGVRFRNCCQVVNLSQHWRIETLFSGWRQSPNNFMQCLISHKFTLGKKKSDGLSIDSMCEKKKKKRIKRAQLCL